MSASTQWKHYAAGMIAGGTLVSLGLATLVATQVVETVFADLGLLAGSAMVVAGAMWLSIVSLARRRSFGHQVTYRRSAASRVSGSYSSAGTTNA